MPGFSFSTVTGMRWTGDQIITPAVFGNAVALARKLEQLRATTEGRATYRACNRLLDCTLIQRDRSDRVVDVVIAMESILTNESREQLGYQFRTIGALLLADVYERRVELRDFLKNAYTDRSQIVHNNAETNLSNAEIADLMNLARRLFLKIVQDGRPDYDRLVLRED
jgi:hypothetical protein